MKRRVGAFSLTELLVAISVAAGLAAIGFGAYAKAAGRGDAVDGLARLRTVGQAILLYATEHDHRLPGPLWPGQVMLYDPQREGRMVRELAGYLGIEQRAEPYLVGRMIPRAFRHAVPGVPLEDIRIYVMNPGITTGGQTLSPFGSLTASPAVEPMKMSALGDLAPAERWMISEADQQHPYVATAPWRASTPRAPLHEGRRGLMKFDGSVEFEQVR